MASAIGIDTTAEITTHRDRRKLRKRSPGMPPDRGQGARDEQPQEPREAHPEEGEHQGGAEDRREGSGGEDVEHLAFDRQRLLPQGCYDCRAERCDQAAPEQEQPHRAGARG